MALSISDFRDVAAYARARPSVRPAMIEHKRRRRVGLGRDLSVCFEDRSTVRYQIQEVIHAEGISRASAILREIEEYSALLPRPGVCTATVMVAGDELGSDFLGGLDDGSSVLALRSAAPLMLVARSPAWPSAKALESPISPDLARRLAEPA